MIRIRPRDRWLIPLLLLVLCSILVFMAYTPSHAQSPQSSALTRGPLHPRVSADVTTLVQTRLHSFGYTIAIDGQYGPQTRRVIAAWQKVNGLTVDGYAGAQTLATLGPISFTAAPVPAVRQTPALHPSGPGSESVEAIIRDVWPDDLEDWAVRIATRESRLVPTVRNYCCYGLFQIYYSVHRGWLSNYGVNSPSDLYDPRVNATVALALYQQTGPSPWSLG